MQVLTAARAQLHWGSVLWVGLYTKVGGIGSALDGINSDASGDESQSKEEVQYGDEEQDGAEITEIRRLLWLLRSGVASHAVSAYHYIVWMWL